MPTFERTRRFRREYLGLPREQREAFKRALAAFIAALRKKLSGGEKGSFLRTNSGEDRHALAVENWIVSVIDVHLKQRWRDVSSQRALYDRDVRVFHPLSAVPPSQLAAALWVRMPAWGWRRCGCSGNPNLISWPGHEPEQGKDDEAEEPQTMSTPTPIPAPAWQPALDTSSA